MTHPTLSPAERKRIKEQLFEEKKKDWPFIKEAIGEADVQVAMVLKIAFLKDDAILFMRACKEALKNYIESELVETAEQEALSSKSINGKRYNEA